MKNCSGERCLMQYDKVDPAICTAVDYCPEATPPRTRADCTRANTDEELAALFSWIETEGRAFGPRGKAAWLDWLREEAT